MFRRVFSRLCFRRSFVTFLPPGTTNIRTRTNNSILRVDGPDAEKFLQGLASNDLLYEGWTKRFSGPAAYTGFFNHRGRYLFDAIIVLCGSSESPTGYLLDIDCGAVGSAIAHFKRYQLKSDVNFVNVTEEYHVQSFVSPDRYLLSEVISCVESLKQDEAKAFFDPRVSSLGVRTISPTSTIFSPKVLDAFFRVADETFLDVHRMLNGVGRFSRELMPTKTIPLEANLDWLNGISFTKGCYLGQELIARTHFRGVIRKRFLPVLFHRSAPGARAAAHPLFSPACSFDPTCLVKFAGSEAAIIESLGTSEEVGSVLTATKGNLAMAKMRTEAIFSTSLSGLTGCRCENFFVHPVIPSWWIPRQ